MAPPKAKLRKRKNNTKKDKGAEEDEVIDMFGLGDPKSSAGQSDFDFPMPPQMGKAAAKEAMKKKTDNDDDDDDDDSDDDDNMNSMPTKSKLRQKQQQADKASHPPLAKAGGDKGIKMGPLIMLLIMFGTTLIPAVLYLGDAASSYWGQVDVMKNIGYQLGMGPVPRKRVVSFYEKHNPDKLADVPKVLRNHYGDYPKLIRKLERKYQDYGYFMGWEEDEAPSRIVQEQFQEWYSIWIQKYWNVHAPVWLRTRVRNIKYNLNGLYKQGRKLWRKYVWPYLLEPLFGVPDEKTAARQKRQDAKRAQEQQRASSSSSRRRKNTDFRDDVED